MPDDMKAVELAEDEVRYMRMELAQCAKAEALGIRRTADIAPDRLAVLLDGYLALLSERRKKDEASPFTFAFVEALAIETFRQTHGPSAWKRANENVRRLWIGRTQDAIQRARAALTGSREHE